MADKLIKSFQDIYSEHFGAEASVDTLVQNLSKAFATTALGDTFGDGTALRLQNLDATMTQVLFDEGHLKFFNFLNRFPSIQPYYEWNRRKSYGSSRASAGFREGGAPRGSTSSYKREGAYVKYLGVRRGITHQMTLTGQLGGTQIDPVAEENRNGTLELLEKTERQLMWGRSEILDATGNNVNYDGFIPLLEELYPKNIIDLRGKPYTFDHIEERGAILFEEGKVRNFRNLKTFMHPQVLTGLSKMKFEADRRVMGGSAESFITGTPLTGHQTNFGFVPFEPHLFMDEVESNAPLTEAADSGAPEAPATVVGTATTPDVATSKFATGDGVGTHYYFVAAFNEAGESLTTASTGVAVAAKKAVDVAIARTAGAVGYRIYRSMTNDAKTAGKIGTIPQPASGDATFRDLNEWIPGCMTVVWAEKSPENLVLAQMTPLIKFPLAIVSTTIEFLLLLYHVLVMKAPERQYVFKNVGKWDRS